MEILKRKDLDVSDDVLQKVMLDLKSELKENKKEIQKLNEMDYKYNQKLVYVDQLIEAIDLFQGKKVNKKQAKNVLMAYSGDPYVTIQICLSALQNCQQINLLIDDMCFAINKFIVELYKDILRDYKIVEAVSFSNYESRSEIIKISSMIDKMYCLGDKNLYNICKKISDLQIEYVPFNVIDIYCEDEEFYELSREIFRICFENGIEAEIYEDMPFDQIIKTINEYGEKYCSIILTKNKDYAERFKREIQSKYVFINENPFNTNMTIIPLIF